MYPIAHRLAAFLLYPLVVTVMVAVFLLAALASWPATLIGDD